MSLRLRDVLLVLFNLLPLALVLDGHWRPFDVIAFYWLELVAVGFFAVLSMVISALYKFFHSSVAEGIGGLMGATFFLLHFGFFIIMTAFMVGSFLPEDTPPRSLTGPLVPAAMVIENMPFFTVLPLVMCWQFYEFLYGFILPRTYRKDGIKPLLSAYQKLFVLFIAAFFGLLVSMQTQNRLWGAVFLSLLKTLVAWAEAHISRQGDAAETQQETPKE